MGNKKDTTRTSKYFLVCAGGTGMRCMQSFINLCALGMFSGQTIDVLLLDTDAENKDKKNTENLIQKYAKLMHSDGDAKANKAGEFFSAQINLYTFIPDYSKETTKRFTLISEIEKGDPAVNKRLGDLFYEEPVQDFDLSHGYRAQTHLGSYLMYHAFIEEIRQANASDEYKSSSDLFKFVDRIREANNEGEARIFSLGSTFGGTGASSIPVMPIAITDAAKIISGGMVEMDNLFYGASLLSNYFTFPSPSDAHKAKDGIIADAQFFPYNSAAALMYYIKDKTILQTYKRFYILGWGEFNKINVADYKMKISGKTGGKTATGGKKQENPAHILEFMSAFSAKHFFEHGKVDELQTIATTEMMFKAVESISKGDEKIPVINFDDLVSSPNTTDKELSIDDQFRDNMYAFLSFCSLLQERYEGRTENLISDLFTYNSSYNLSEEEIEALDFFCSYFAMRKETDEGEEIAIPGWFAQMWHSLNEAPDGTFLGMDPVVFGKDTDWLPNWNRLYTETANDNPFDEFVKRFKKLNHNAKGSDYKQFLKDIRSAFTSFTPIVVDPSAANRKTEQATELV